MHRFLTALALYLSHLNLIACIPCRQIGRGYYHEGGKTKKQFEPFTPGQGFDTIEPMKCYHRFQNRGYHLRGIGIEIGKLGKAMDACKWLNLLLIGQYDVFTVVKGTDCNTD